MDAEERKRERAKRMQERSEFQLREQRAHKEAHAKKREGFRGYKRPEPPDPEKPLLWWLE